MPSKRSTVCGLLFSATTAPKSPTNASRDLDESRPRKRRALAALHIWTAVTRHRSQHLDSSRCASRSRVSPTISNRLQSAVCGLRSAVSRSPHPPNRVGAKPLYAAKPRGGEAPLRGPLFDWSTAPESATFPVLAPQINAATTEFRPQPVIFRRRTKSAFPFSAFSFHPSACSHYPLPATTSVVAGQPVQREPRQKEGSKQPTKPNEEWRDVKNGET